MDFLLPHAVVALVYVALGSLGAKRFDMRAAALGTCYVIVASTASRLAYTPETFGLVEECIDTDKGSRCREALGATGGLTDALLLGGWIGFVSWALAAYWLTTKSADSSPTEQSDS